MCFWVLWEELADLDEYSRDREVWRRKGYLYVRVDGEIQEVVSGMKLSLFGTHGQAIA